MTNQQINQSSGAERVKSGKIRPRKVWLGDVLDGKAPDKVLQETIRDRSTAKLEQEIAVIEDIMDHASNRTRSLNDYLNKFSEQEKKEILALLKEDLEFKQIKHPDEILSKTWHQGGYPYEYLISRKTYENRSTSCR